MPKRGKVTFTTSFTIIVWSVMMKIFWLIQLMDITLFSLWLLIKQIPEA